MSAFKPRILKNDNDYNEAMDRISELMEMSPEVDSEEFNELEMISLFIEDYESKHYKVNKPSAIDAIKFRMDQDGLTQKDMEQYLGSRSKVSEVLSGKRNLSQTMIKKLHYGLDIPYDILMQDPDDIADEGIINSVYQLTLNCTGNIISLNDTIPAKADRKSGVSFSF